MKIQKHRPVSVTILAVIVLTFTVLNAIRFWATLAEWETLTKLGVNPSPLYIALTGLFWTVCGAGLFFSLWRGHPAAPQATIIIVSLYSSAFWLDRFIFQNEVARVNNVFALFATILVVFYTGITVSLPSSKNFFERKP